MPSTTDLEHLGLSYATFRTLIHLQPCPLASAPALRCLQLGESTERGWWIEELMQKQMPIEVSVADAEALVAALPGLRQLELYSLVKGAQPAAPEALQRLQALAPRLAVRTVFVG